MRSTVRAVPFVSVLVAMALTVSCAKKPGVSIEQLYEANLRETGSADSVTPPWCRELPGAIYPSDLALDERPDRVDVRVELTLDEFGKPRNIKTVVLDDIADPEPFERAARMAAEELRCVPAIRPPAPESGRDIAATIAYRTSLLFHFYRDGREALATTHQGIP